MRQVRVIWGWVGWRRDHVWKIWVDEFILLQSLKWNPCVSKYLQMIDKKYHHILVVAHIQDDNLLVSFALWAQRIGACAVVQKVPSH